MVKEYEELLRSALEEAHAKDATIASLQQQIAALSVRRTDDENAKESVPGQASGLPQLESQAVVVPPQEDLRALLQAR
jgi:hypothetical protein